LSEEQKTAMVLAAGYGERLKPLTDTCPKPLLPVGGTPILHIILRLLKREGFNRVVINLHHLGHMIKESVGDGNAFGLDVRYSEEGKILGTGGGIKAAQQLLGDKTFLVINGDILVNAPLGEIWKYHRDKDVAATLVVKDDPNIPGWGAVKVDKECYIRQILGKPSFNNPLKSRLFVGIQVIEPVFFDFLTLGNKASSTQDVYPEMLKRGLSICSYEYSGTFIDIGTPEKYAEARSSEIIDRI